MKLFIYINQLRTFSVLLIEKWEMVTIIEEVRKQVYQLLGKNNDGHGMEHIDRVFNLALNFAQKEEANKEIVSLISLLHNVDDYKLFGIENSNNLTNSRKILKQCSIEEETINKVLDAISTIRYSKRLKGIKPITLEAKVVSDADMCDALGATGVIRSYRYNLAHGNSFFDRNIYPVLNMNVTDYMSRKDGTVVTHMFEKLLRLKDLMLTNSGKQEAISRHSIMIEFLYHFFKEENVPEWTEYLDNYINTQ